MCIRDRLFHVLKNVTCDWGSVYYLFGLATYFHMGNSNSLASVDVGSGYNGVTSFNPVLITSLIAVNTFNGPIIWTLLLYCRLSQKQNESQLVMLLKTIGLYRGCELLFITLITTICRCHSMVWTVFAPKILFEGMLAFILALLHSLVYLMSNFMTRESKSKTG